MGIVHDKLNSYLVDQLMIPISKLPTTLPNNSYMQISALLSEYNLGAVFIVNTDNKLEGVVTDGDVRRTFKKHGPLPLFTLNAQNFATMKPKYCYLGESLFDVLVIMEHCNKKISCLPVVDEKGILCGAVTLHSIVSFLLSLD